MRPVTFIEMTEYCCRLPGDLPAIKERRERTKTVILVNSGMIAENILKAQKFEP